MAQNSYIMLVLGIDFHLISFEEKCPVLSNPSYGSVTIIPSGQIAVYLCNPGYEIRGFSLRTCKSNGQWTGYAPVCIKTQGMISSGNSC